MAYPGITHLGGCWGFKYLNTFGVFPYMSRTSYKPISNMGILEYHVFIPLSSSEESLNFLTEAVFLYLDVYSKLDTAVAQQSIKG